MEEIIRQENTSRRSEWEKFQDNESKIKNTDKMIKRFLQRLEKDYGDSEMLGDVQYMFSAIENEMI